ncbi:hypothetical protein BN1723_020126, partial [Verticillium longisporum]
GRQAPRYRRDHWRQRCREEARPRSGQDEGFHEVPASFGEVPQRQDPHQGLGRAFQPPQRGRAQVPVGSLHGLWCSFLPVGDWLPHLQHHSQVERAGLPEPVARRPQPSPDDQQLPRVYRPCL